MVFASSNNSNNPHSYYRSTSSALVRRRCDGSGPRCQVTGKRCRCRERGSGAAMGDAEDAWLVEFPAGFSGKLQFLHGDKNQDSDDSGQVRGSDVVLI